MSNLLSYLEHAELLFPEKIAVSDGKEKLTYTELVDRSKEVGRQIKLLGQTNSPVCVLAYRSVFTLVHFFGVLYSGNYYVPLDPDMPAEKRQLIIDDCNPIALCGDLSTKDTVGILPRVNMLNTVTPNSDLTIPEISSSMPAYMVYTSGSTGKPKGVLKSHGAIMSFAEAYCETFHFDSNEIIGNQTPFFFDASAKDIYMALKLGATIEIIPTEKFAMPTDLIEYLNEKKVSFISWVPTALAIVAQLKTFHYVLPQYLRRVFFVGEVMPVKYLNYWREYLPNIQYVNLYGQSELAGISCYYEVDREFENSDALPMGKPLCNCRLYLVKDNKIITEPNETGEIYIVSDALANEYYNDPEKTLESFLIRDFGHGNARCFKSGDLASLDTNGNFIFATRSDFQIKHLGHRIELGEIEAVAGALPEITRCACLYNSEKQSIILFAEVSSKDVTSKEIKSKLRQKLSSYMIPEKIRILDKMPINANGKIHRQQLKELL